MDDTDRKRFVADLLFMNSINPVNNMNYHFSRSMDLRRPYDTEILPSPEEKLVTIHAWSIMNNHYHLLLSELAEDGISLFLKKLNGGYAKYFNERYKRSGALFQGKTKRKFVSNNSYYLYILHYIHFNPLDYLKGARAWRNKRVAKSKEALKWLTEYRWSSFQDYSGKENFPHILAGSFMFEDREEIFKEGERFLNSLQEDSDLLAPLWLE